MNGYWLLAAIVATCFVVALFVPPRLILCMALGAVAGILILAATRAWPAEPSIFLVALPSSGNASGAWVVVPGGIAWRTDRVFANGGE